ncbi:hypothetical protein [Vitiosangium sp. GDMCC 1.1324]|uniref:hypothetical protein n=1 Tax=Vitiosangium sp. (strain GDMCC 1.1324) TaxID=2138576 RepID=UPI000D350DB8|nr:hypothetical protein [Vitiosangium sp. GDMCC 1.1324]PTL79243.1 hypothetical protein DAT35_34100 [Vitiosangium sp. GDMCC 1.1324]
MSFQPPTGFWKSFAREVWGKQPRVFKKVFGGELLASPEELFRVASEETVRYAPTAGAWMRPRPSRVAIERGQLMVQLPYMPRQEDGSFEGWARRMRQETKGQSFCFHMSGLQSRSNLIFERYRQFTDGLFQEIGLPPWRIDSDIFAGDYRETPFGVHKDVTGNFAFIAEGHKRMLLWTYESLLPYTKGGLDPESLDFTLQIRSFTELPPPAMALEGEPGDLFYWPGSFWHCAEGTGGLSVTNNLAIYLNTSPLVDSMPDKVFEAVLPPLEEDMSFTAYEPARRQELAGALPESLRDSTRRAVEGLKRLVDGGLEREMELSWLRYVSGSGFLQVPPPDSGAVLDEARAMKLATHAGLVWRKLASGELAVAANGNVTCFPESRGLVELLQRLSGGGSHRVGALLDEAVEERQGGSVVWSRERMRDVLTALVAKRALVGA